MDKINKEFFLRNAEVVARELLGCEIVSIVDGKELRGRIVETEAYFDERDPASRACQNGDLRETMMMNGGNVLIYGVHNNWLVNFVTDCESVASAVLIRAIEPLNFNGRGNGPGLLTRALGIDKRFHKKKIGDGLKVVVRKEKPLIGQSFRIGVKKDLSKPMRFFIKNSPFISRK